MQRRLRPALHMRMQEEVEEYYEATCAYRKHLKDSYVTSMNALRDVAATSIANELQKTSAEVEGFKVKWQEALRAGAAARAAQAEAMEKASRAWLSLQGGGSGGACASVTTDE